MSLPEPDEFFDPFFRPHFPAGRLEGRMFPATFPDAMRVKVGMSEERICVLPPQWRDRSAQGVAGRAEAARGDWPKLLGVSGEIDFEWVRAFDAKHDAAYVSALLARSDPSKFDNEVLILCCEFGSVLGYVLKSMRPELVWAYDYPYWDSWLYSSRKGLMINVFSWAMKKFSAFGIDDGYAAKLTAVAGMLD